MITHTLTSTQALTIGAALEALIECPERLQGHSLESLQQGMHRALIPWLSGLVHSGFRGFCIFRFLIGIYALLGTPNSAQIIFDRYDQLGEKFLDGIWGRFSVVGFDIQNNLVFAGTDPTDH